MQPRDTADDDGNHLAPARREGRSANLPAEADAARIRAVSLAPYRNDGIDEIVHSECVDIRPRSLVRPGFAADELANRSRKMFPPNREFFQRRVFRRNPEGAKDSQCIRDRSPHPNSSALL